MGEKLGLYKPPDGLKPAVWEKEEFLSKTRRQLGLIYHGDQRVYNELRGRVSLYASEKGEDAEQILKTIEQLRITLKHEVDFVRAVLGGILLHWTKWSRENPKLAEELDRKWLMSKEGNIPLSDLMYANYTPGKPTTLRIHVAPGETLGSNLIKRALAIGLKKLKVLLTENQAIREVTATSWIVADKPDIFMDLGFVIEQAGKDEIRRDFSDEVRPILRATISREKLLEARTYP